MGLIRRGSKAYYYRSVRVDGRVTGRYVASGQTALVLGRLDAIKANDERRERVRLTRHDARMSTLDRDLREAERAWRERLKAEDRAFKAYFDGVESVARAALAAAGYHQHARGQWRRRMKGRRRGEAGCPGAAGLPAVVDDPLDALIRRVMAGDPDTLPAVRKLLRGAVEAGIGPAVFAAYGGDPASAAEDRLVDAWAGENLLAREALRCRLATLRGELAGPDPTPIERLLAERAALCWLAVYRLEAMVAGLDPATVRADRLGKQVDRAHRRLVSALRMIATVRRLATPTVHIGLPHPVDVTGAKPGLMDGEWEFPVA